MGTFRSLQTNDFANIYKCVIYAISLFSSLDVQRLLHVFLKVGYGFTFNNSVIFGTDFKAFINGPSVIDFLCLRSRAAKLSLLRDLHKAPLI